MRGLLAALLYGMTAFASAHAGLSIPVSEEVYGFIVILSGIVIASVFILAFIADRRNRANREKLPPRPLSEVEQKKQQAVAELTEAFKKAGWK